MRRSSWLAIGMAAMMGGVLAGCSDRPTEMSAVPTGDRARQGGDTITPRLVRQLARSRGVTAYPRPPHVRPALVQLGRELAFDKILSGNHDVSCMTCHLPRYETGDGRSLSIGSAGVGLGPNRTQPDGIDIPRNAPPLFNLGAMRHLFWDGRVEVDAHGHFSTPAGAQLTKDMTKVFEFGPVSAQPMFPPTSAAEMRGTSGSRLSRFTDDDATQIWAALMRRLGRIPRYRRMFEEAYPGKRFERDEFRLRLERDRRIHRERDDVPQRAVGPLPGWRLSRAHAAPARWRGDVPLAQVLGLPQRAQLQRRRIPNVAVPQIGPGKGNGASGLDDFGRMNVTSESGRPVSVPHVAAAQRGADGPVWPRWVDHLAARLHRPLQQLGPEAHGLQSGAADRAAPEHGIGRQSRSDRRARHDHPGRGIDAGDRRQVAWTTCRP